MRKTMTFAAALLAIQLWAGGFYLQLGNPEANPEAKHLNAALVVKAWGCHDPASASLTARAVGVVNGQRIELPLKVDKMSEKGTFALKQQWPADSRWVIELVARQGDMMTNTLVTAGPKGIDRMNAKSNMKAFAETDLEAMLH